MINDNIQVLDCTLRDGAYIVNSRFGASTIKGIIKKMQDANIDIIECGWLKNSPHTEGSSFYHVPSDLEQYLSEKNPNATYVVMIDWDRYDLSYLPEYDGKSIDAIRVVFPQGKFREGIAVGTEIKNKGYKVFLQAANTLGYSDRELLDLADEINRVKPVSLSVVDTFGTMFANDLSRIVNLLDRNLDPDIKLGFHSHNNQQLSFALSMQFVEMFNDGRRGIVVDSSLCGMGRGAGNTTTELLVSYLNRKQNANYDLNVIMDAIDMYMGYFIENYDWGYSTPYFISGMYCAHVNNIAYLQKNHRTTFKEMRNVIEMLPVADRRVYDYDLLEKTYLDYQNKDVDDTETLAHLKETFANRKVLLIAPGSSVNKEKEKIQTYITREDPIVIGTNHVFDDFDCDYLFFSNPQRYEYAKDIHSIKLSVTKKILLSNIVTEGSDDELIINFNLLVKRGWEHFDNAIIMCLRLMSKLHVRNVALAGFDGFSNEYSESYCDTSLPSLNPRNNWDELNAEIQDMLRDFVISNAGNMEVMFITESYYDQKNRGR